MPKATQRILAVRTIMVKPEEHRRSIRAGWPCHPGPIRERFGADFGYRAAIALWGGFPRLGQRVKAGDVLAQVQPALGAADVTSQQQQARELDQQIALVQRRLERLRPIAQVIARSQIEDDANSSSRDCRTGGPISSGRHVSPRASWRLSMASLLPQLQHPDRWSRLMRSSSRSSSGPTLIEALTFDAVAGATNATARLNDGRSLRLTYQGTGFADRNQAIPIHFAVDESTRGLRWVSC